MMLPMSPSYLVFVLSLYLTVKNTASVNGCIQVRALHWDVEPHSLPLRWANDREELSREYLTLLDRLRAECLSQSSTGLSLAADVSMHYDLILANQDPYVSVTIAGVTKTLAEWVVTKLDYLIVMAYRDKATGLDSIISNTEGEVALSEAALNKPTVIAAVETNAAGLDKVDFSNEGVGAMEAALAETDSHFQGRPGFAGTAVHDYTGYKKLLATKGTPSKAPTRSGNNVPERGLFVWDYTIALDNSKTKTLLSFIAARGISHVYFESQLLVHRRDLHQNFSIFLSKLNQENIKVDLLHGAHNWAGKYSTCIGCPLLLEGMIIC